MRRQPKILVVDDEPAVRELIGAGLRRGGLAITEAGSAAEAQAAVLADPPDLILLDWMLPDRSGLDFARQLRHERLTRDIPLILITARQEEWDKVQGLDTGADDYVTKPFSVNELLARVRAVLRRTSPEHATRAVEIEGLRLDSETHRVTVDGQPLDPPLGRTEFALLEYFMTRAERVHSRDQIIDSIWGSGAYLDQRTVDVHVRRLRKALAPSGHDRYIQTVRGLGYRFSARP